MTPDAESEDVRELLFRLLRAPERERDQLLAHERSNCSQVAAAAEQAFAEAMSLVDGLPDDPAAARAALATGPTLGPLVREALDWILPALGGPGRGLEPLPPIHTGELLPNYSSKLAEGTKFGYYLIEKKLGQGGMGVVYLARDTRFDDCPPVALKLMLRIDAGRADRFRDEAAILYVLAQESNVVGIRDYATEPAPFIAMEYVEGGSLDPAAWPGRDRDGARAAAELVRALASTLQEAHRRGIFHLDLKPANVLLHRKRGPVLADFSLARRVRDGDGGAITLTGTPAYLAPEQAAPGCNPNPTFIDVYGLGAILYELLTGRPPFVCRDEETLSSLLARIRTNDPPPPRELVPDVPPDLEAICLHCLRRKPEERYPSADKVANDLGAFLRGERPGVAHWPWHRRARHFAWHWRARIAVGLTLAAGAVLTLMSLWYRTEAAEARAQRAWDRAVYARQQLRASARSAAGQGNWQVAMELYESAIRDYKPDDPERLALEVERLPGWFLYHSREEVAAELTRLDQMPALAPKERARVQLYQADLRLGADGRTPDVLALLRRSLGSGKLDRADTLYAEALLAPTSRAALERLRQLVKSHPGHYRGRVAFLGVLFVRGELDELRQRLLLHQDRFPGDPSSAILAAVLDILQKDDLPLALARLDRVRDRLGEKRREKWRGFLTQWARILRAVAQQEAPDPLDILRLKAIAGGDGEVFSFNVPTVCWLWEHWGAAMKALALSKMGIFAPPPEALLKKWQAVCDDSPEATFLVQNAFLEFAVARQAEKRGRQNEALQHLRRAVDLNYQAADARAPTLLPRSEWRYKALHMAILTDTALRATRGQVAQPAREKRLRDAVRRAVTEGRDHRASRAQRLPQLVAHLSGLARTYPRAVSPDLAQRLLIEWMQEEADNPVPYRLRAKLALDLKEPVTAWHIARLWYKDKRHPKDGALDELGKKAKIGVEQQFLQLAKPRPG